jgi:hypothetical protein
MKFILTAFAAAGHRQHHHRSCRHPSVARSIYPGQRAPSLGTLTDAAYYAASRSPTIAAWPLAARAQQRDRLARIAPAACRGATGRTLERPGDGAAGRLESAQRAHSAPSTKPTPTAKMRVV